MQLLLPPANATFDASAGTITFATTIPATISHISAIFNITRKELYFLPGSLGGTYASPTLTLPSAMTAAHADTDELQIIYDDGNAILKEGGDVSVSNLPTDFAKDGTDISSPSAMPAGGVGLRGWISAIFTALKGIISVGGITDTISATPTLTASSAYASGNTGGGLLTFANAARVSSGQVIKVVVASKSAQTSSMDLVLLDANPTSTTVTDKSAVALAVADSAKVVGTVNLLNWTNTGTTSNCTVSGAGLTFKIPTGTTLYGILIMRGTPTFTSTSDITINLGVIQD